MQWRLLKTAGNTQQVLREACDTSLFEAGDVRSLFASEWLHATYTSYTAHLVQHTPSATATTSHTLLQTGHVIQGALGLFVFALF